MKTLKIENISDVVFIGDIHGEFITLVRQLKESSDILPNSAIIACGDIGVGFYDMETNLKKLKDLNKSLKDLNLTMYCIRGNHDNPNFFNGSIKKLKAFKNLIFVEDYTVLLFNESSPNKLTLNVLCAGGGISIDRTKRTLNKSYWKDEEFVYKEEELDNLMKVCLNVDVVCTHSAPSFCEYTDTKNIDYWLMIDKPLKEDLNRERSEHDKLLKKLKSLNMYISHWFYGHFHGKWSKTIDGTRYQMLNMVSVNHKLDMEIINLDYIE